MRSSKRRTPVAAQASSCPRTGCANVTVQRHHAWSLAWLVPMAATAAPAQQGAAVQPVLEVIVVTATKRAESLSDVPLAVSAISAQDIQAQGITQYADYLNSVPGVYFEDPGPGQQQIRMRGIVADEDGGSSTVATYFGETLTSIYTVGNGKPNLRMVDIDRVEVLRGPQGTLFGANSLSGVVRVVPAAPDLRDFDADVGLRGFSTAHSDDASYHVEGVMNYPIIEDRVALRLVAYKDDIAGYIDNVVPANEPVDFSDLFGADPGTLVIPGNPAFTRKDINSEDTWGARAALSWQANDRLRFDMTYAKQRVTLDSEPQVQADAGEYAQRRALDFFDLASYSEDLSVGSLVVNYLWDSVSMISASSYTSMKRGADQDYSFLFANSFGLPLPAGVIDDTQGRLFTQEVRLQSRGDAPLQWTAGLFYLDAETDQNQSAIDYSCPSCLPQFLFGQDVLFSNAPGSDARFLTQQQLSAFGEISYSITPRWTVGVGGRYLEEDVNGFTPAVIGLVADGSTGFLPAEPVRTVSSSEANPSGFMRFKPSEQLTLYAQAARGFRSGRANERLSFTGDCAADANVVGLGPTVDPDTLWNYELGAKSRLADGRLSVDVAAYRQKWEGVQLHVSLPCGFGGTINAGDVSGNGAELEVAALLGAGWRLSLSAAYSHNEFDSVSPSTGFVEGERIPGAPELNAGAGLEYNFTLGKGWESFARADYVYVDSVPYKFQTGDPSAPELVEQPSRGTANVRLGVSRDRIAFDLFARNVTDRRAIVNTTSAQLGNYQYLLRPREIGIETRYSFR